MTTRLALVLLGCCSIGAAAASRAQDVTLPFESSFITKLADEAIVADGAEAVRNRDYSRSVFALAFLGGYANPESNIPVNSALSSSRMNGAGWAAGQAYRRAHPESLEQIMQEYGYQEFEGGGTWTVGFEAGGFQPDNEASNSSQACWYPAFIRSAQLNEQLAKIVPGDAVLRGATLRVRVKGYVSEAGRFGHFGMCQRQVYSVSVVADGG